MLPKLIVTVKGKPTGRSQQIKKSILFDWSQKNNLPIKEIDNLKEPSLIKEIAGLKCQLGILAALGKIVPSTLINSFPYGIINIHPSYLPKLRGPSPIQYALLAGFKKTGVTIMKLDEELDHGPILTQTEVDILPDELYPDLEHKLANLGADLLVKALPEYLARKFELIAQNHEQATFTKKISREHGRINWQNQALNIYNQWRAFWPWPGIFTNWQGQNLKLITIKVINLPSITPGLVRFDNNLYIDAKNFSLLISQLQLAGGKELAAKDFIRGHQNFINSKLV